MASERFKFLIGDLPPEEPKRELTKEEKAKNFWHYHKWYFLIGAIALALIIGTIVAAVSKVKPDYTFGLISVAQHPEALTSSLEKALEAYADDRNGDGKIAVRINQYNLSYNEDEAAGGDPNIRMANVTRLMGDLQTCESMIFFVDDIVGAQSTDGYFAYNDGTIPEEGAEIDFSKMGVRWGESAALSGLEMGKIEMYGVENEEDWPDGQKFMQGFTMVLRAYDPSEKPEGKNSLYYYDCLKIFDKLLH